MQTRRSSSNDLGPLSSRQCTPRDLIMPRSSAAFGAEDATRKILTDSVKSKVKYAPRIHIITQPELCAAYVPFVSDAFAVAHLIYAQCKYTEETEETRKVHER